MKISVLNRFGITIALVLILSSCGRPTQESSARPGDTIIFDGVLIDIENHGRSMHDVDGMAIIIRGDIIVAIESVDQVDTTSCHVIGAKGKYILPGLCDGFAVINNQSYANAFLHSGITDVIGVESERRGKFFHKSLPGPDVHMLSEVGEFPSTDEEILTQIGEQHSAGSEILLLMYKLSPDQVELAHRLAKNLGMGTIGELGFTSYEQGVKIGVDAFVHTSRYSLDIAPDTLAKLVAQQPFSNNLGSPKWRYYKYLSGLDAGNPELQAHARNLGTSKTFLIPTFGLLYLHMPFAENPWDEPVSQLIDPSDVNRPADLITGRHSYSDEEEAEYVRLALQQLMIEREYKRAGAQYLAGSATDVWGTMPGISLHQELEVLKYIGLSEREVIATATSNYSSAFGLNYGLIAKGFKANILLFANNPLKDLEELKHAEILILNGKRIERESLLEIQ